MKIRTLLSLMVCVSSMSFAQISIPQPSPLSTVTQEFGLGKITIEYSRPSMKGRTIFGDLVPFDKRWRTGANASTKFKCSDNIKIEGQELAAGKYSLLTIPGATEWTIIFNSDTSLWGDGYEDYTETKDVLRVKVKPYQIAEKVETFTILINDITSTSSTLELIWDNVIVPVKLSTEIDSRIMTSIENTMKGTPNASSYYAAARYYFENDKDLTQALTFIKKANELKQEAYWMMHLQAKILAKQGNKKEAIEAANKSKEAAMKDKNDDYVKMNDKLISDLK
jgi:hypothetical protein